MEALSAISHHHPRTITPIMRAPSCAETCSLVPWRIRHATRISWSLSHLKFPFHQKYGKQQLYVFQCTCCLATLIEDLNAMMQALQWYEFASTAKVWFGGFSHVVHLSTHSTVHLEDLCLGVAVPSSRHKREWGVPLFRAIPTKTHYVFVVDK